MTTAKGQALFAWHSREMSTGADGSAQEPRITGFYLLFDDTGNVWGAELPVMIKTAEALSPVTMQGRYLLDDDEITIDWQRMSDPPLRPEDQSRTRRYFTAGEVQAYFEGTAVQYKELTFRLVAGNPDFLFDD